MIIRQTLGKAGEKNKHSTEPDLSVLCLAVGHQRKVT